MKNTVKAIFLSVLITFGSFFMTFGAANASPPATHASAQNQDVNAYCSSVGSTAAGIAQYFLTGKTIKDLEPDFKSQEFLKLTPVEQEFIKALAEYVFFVGKDIEPFEHYVGAMTACINSNGNLQPITDAINKELSKNAI